MAHEAEMRPCPKCGTPARTGVILCLQCDYVLDVSAVADELPELSDAAFSELSGVFPAPADGDDLDDPTDVSINSAPPFEAASWAGSALILGDPSRSQDVSDEDGWLSDVTSTLSLPDGVRSVSLAGQKPTGAALGDLLEPAVVLGIRPGAPLDQIELTVAEKAVVRFVNGVRPVARLAKKAGLSVADTRNALGLLLDRNALVFVARLEADSLLAAVQDEANEFSARFRFSPATIDAATAAQLNPPQNPQSAPPTSGGEEAPPLVDLPSDALMPLPEGAASAGTVEPSPWGEATVPLTDAPGVAAPSAESIFRGPATRPQMSVRPAAAVAPVQSAVARPRVERTGFDKPVALESAVPAVAPRPAARAPVGPDAAQKARIDELLRSAVTDVAEGRRTRAQTYLRMVLQIDPQNESAHTLLMEHIGASHAAVPIGSANDDPLLREAAIAEANGQTDRALRLLRDAGSKQPRNPEIYNRIAIILALKKRNPMAAALILLKACELAPDNPAYRSNLGKVCKMSEDATLNPELVSGEGVAAAPKAKGSLLDRLRSRPATK